MSALAIGWQVVAQLTLVSKTAAPISEWEVHAALSGLAEAWRIIQSVALAVRRHGRGGDGEADVVLLHPDRRVVVLEVKGRDVAVNGGQV